VLKKGCATFAFYFFICGQSGGKNMGFGGFRCACVKANRVLLNASA